MMGLVYVRSNEWYLRFGAIQTPLTQIATLPTSAGEGGSKKAREDQKPESMLYYHAIGAIEPKRSL